MYFINKNGNIASNYEGRLLFIDNEYLPIKLVFNKQEDDYYIRSHTMGYWVRHYDKQIEEYFSRFSSVKSLYADIKMRGGTIFFDDKVIVHADIENGRHIIWFESTLEFDESCTKSMGYSYETYSDGFSVHTDGHFVITKNIIDFDTHKVCVDMQVNFNTLIHVILSRDSAPSLYIPLFNSDGKKDGTMMIEDVCIPKPETIIRYMNDVARAKFSGRRVNNLVINSFILPDGAVYVREVEVDYNTCKSGVHVRKLDESDCIYEEAKRLGTYMTEKRFKNISLMSERNAFS